MPTGGRKGEEVDVPGGMPPAAPELLPLCCLGGWTAGGGGDGNLEEVIQYPFVNTKMLSMYAWIN